MSAAGWDTMHAIFDTIKKLNGKVEDGSKVIDAMKGWSTNGPRGKVTIDAATRDIVQDEHAMEVIRKPDGKLGVKVLGTTKRGEGRVQGAQDRALRFLIARTFDTQRRRRA